MRRHRAFLLFAVSVLAVYACAGAQADGDMRKGVPPPQEPGAARPAPVVDRDAAAAAEEGQERANDKNTVNDASPLVGEAPLAAAAASAASAAAAAAEQGVPPPPPPVPQPGEPELQPAHAEQPAQAGEGSTTNEQPSVSDAVAALSPSAPTQSESQAAAQSAAAAAPRSLEHTDSAAAGAAQAGKEHDVVAQASTAIKKRRNPHRSALPFADASNPWAGVDSASQHQEADEAAAAAAAAGNDVPTAPSRRPNLGFNRVQQDDYYGLYMNHLDNVDPAAFQPSHILDFRLEPGQTQQFFEEIDQETVGRVIRGDWFVTEGDVFSLKVEILSPSGVAVYAEGPLEEIETNGVTEKRPMEQGSFKFVARDVGTYTVNIVNPSSSYSRAVAFAWLVGRDDDDPVVGQLLDGDHEFMGAEPSVRGAFINVLAQSSRVHKRLDEVSAMLEYADVRYKRHMATVQSTLARLNWYTAIEMLLTIAAAVTQVLFVRNLKYHSGLPSLV